MNLNSVLVGGIAVAAFVAGLFFLRYWRTTGDRFFMFFAISFWLEGAHRLALYQWLGPDEASPLYYLPRLLAYGLIIAAIVDKNRKSRPQA
jgi:hypothetical protein